MIIDVASSDSDFAVHRLEKWTPTWGCKTLFSPWNMGLRSKH